MKTIFNLVLAIAITISIQSCATLFTPSKQSITFESTPPGAKVSINGIDKGVTPCVVMVKKQLESPTITYRLEGYETRNFDLEKSLALASVFNTINIFGWLIDIASGKVTSYDNTLYQMEMYKK
jgi:hypothetical protein